MSKGFGQLLNQAKKMQVRFQKLQEEMEHQLIEAQAGGGMVSCVVNGKQDLISLKISDEAWAEQDKDLLEDLIIACVNEGLSKSKDMFKDELSKISGGLNLPFGM